MFGGQLLLIVGTIQIIPYFRFIIVNLDDVSSVHIDIVDIVIHFLFLKPSYSIHVVGHR